MVCRYYQRSYIRYLGVQNSDFYCNLKPFNFAGGNKTNTDSKGDAGKKTKPNSGKNEAKELQALAFGGPAKKKNKNKKGPAVKQPSKDSAQFEEWKQKDVEVRHCMLNTDRVY